MKSFFFLFMLSILFASSSECGKKTGKTEYQGKLEIKGICSNYTISLVSGEIDTSRIVASWTDENTNKTYRNVFAIGNRCDFPASIKEGESFYFTIDTAAVKSCMICEAYYPTPPRSLQIKVKTQ